MHAGAQVQSVQAYVISGVQERWLSTSKVLATLGIQPQRVVPIKPTQKLAEREFIVRRPPWCKCCATCSAACAERLSLERNL